MFNSKKSKDDDKSRSLNAVDPSVEARVDAMMSEDNLPLAQQKPAIPAESAESTSAPLLPEDKLPNFDNIKAPEEKTENLPKSPEKPLAKPAPVKASETSSIPLPEPEQPPAEAEQPVALLDKAGVNSPETEKAVDELSREESDRVLAIEDAKAELIKEGTAEIERGFGSRLKNFLSRKTTRYVFLFIVLASIAAVLALPNIRYALLNRAGVRVSSSIKVIDNSTRQPLKNVEVTISGVSGKSDENGNVKLEKLKLGQQDLEVKKPAFADYGRKVTLGWGSNPLGEASLNPVGSRYRLELKDFLSNQPVKNAEAVSGEASAKANEKGEISLVIADQEKETVDIEIIANKYRKEKIRFNVGEKEVQKIKMVPNRKHAFVSKRSGKYDLYKIDVDGKNERKILAGAGTEREESMVILAHSTKNIIAFVSARGEKNGDDGFALSSLNIINLDNNKITHVTDSERIQLADFIGDKLIFVRIAENAKADDPLRHRIVSLDIDSNDKTELASSNYFNDILSAHGQIYYTPAMYKVNGAVGLYRIGPEGGNRTTISNQEVWNLFRVEYEKINASVGQDWYEYDSTSSQFNKLATAPPEPKSRVYVDSPNAKKSAWVDERDGKGVLVIYDKSSKKDKVLASMSGLQNPIYWLDDDHIVMRVSNSSETADYIVSLSGGEAKKILDVTNTAGLDRWYYY